MAFADKRRMFLNFRCYLICQKFELTKNKILIVSKVTKNRQLKSIKLRQCHSPRYYISMNFTLNFKISKQLAGGYNNTA